MRTPHGETLGCFNYQAYPRPPSWVGLLAQPLMFSLGVINYTFISPCLEKLTCMAYNKVCRHIRYLCLLIWPEPTCHAPSNMGIGYLRNTGAFCFALCHPPVPEHIEPWEMGESHPHRMNQPLWQGSVRSKDHTEDHKSLFYCSFSPFLLAEDKKGGMDF